MNHKNLDQIKLIRVQPQVPDKKIKEIGSKPRDNGTGDIFRPEPKDNPETINLFEET